MALRLERCLRLYYNPACATAITSRSNAVICKLFVSSNRSAGQSGIEIIVCAEERQQLLANCWWHSILIKRPKNRCRKKRFEPLCVV